MPFKWDLRMVMAQKGIWTGAELKRLLEEKAGLKISTAGISRLLNDKQSEMKLIVLDALCDVLECEIEDLLIQTTTIKNEIKIIK